MANLHIFWVEIKNRKIMKKYLLYYEWKGVFDVFFKEHILLAFGCRIP